MNILLNNLINNCACSHAHDEQYEYTRSVEFFRTVDIRSFSRRNRENETNTKNQRGNHIKKKKMIFQIEIPPIKLNIYIRISVEPN